MAHTEELHGQVAEIEWQTSPDGTEWGYVYYHPVTRKPKYRAALSTVRCIDDRFWRSYKLELRDFLKYLFRKTGTDNLDPFVWVGGGLMISSPPKLEFRECALYQIGASILLHDPKILKIYNHHDCGCAGGIARFGGDEQAEFAFHCRELTRAYYIVSEVFADLDIRLHFINCRGIIRVKPNPAHLRS